MVCTKALGAVRSRRRGKEGQDARRVRRTGRESWGWGVHWVRSPEPRRLWWGFDLNLNGSEKPKEDFVSRAVTWSYWNFMVFSAARAFPSLYRHVRDHYYREFYATLHSTPSSLVRSRCSINMCWLTSQQHVTLWTVSSLFSGFALLLAQASPQSSDHSTLPPPHLNISRCFVFILFLLCLHSPPWSSCCLPQYWSLPSEQNLSLTTVGILSVSSLLHPQGLAQCLAPSRHPVNYRWDIL